MPATENRKFVTDASGRRRPVVDTGVEPELIGQVQVVRDAHLQLADPGKPASTAERRSGGSKGVGNTLGSFVLGEVFESRNRNSISPDPVGRVVFEGADQIIKTRFKKLTPVEDVATAEAARIRTEAPDTDIEDWLLCVTEPGKESDVRQIRARLANLDQLSVLQSTTSLPLYTAESRITLCPAQATDPKSAMTSGTITVVVPGQNSCNIIFKVLP